MNFESSIGRIQSLSMKALAVSVALAVTGTAAVQTPETESVFEKFEFRIPMRDGIHLYTAVYVPQSRFAH